MFSRKVSIQMDQIHACYYLFPSVVKAGVKTKIKILPRGAHARFDSSLVHASWEEKKVASMNPLYAHPNSLEVSYTISIVPVEYSQELLSADERTYCTLSCKPQPNGSLEIEHTFEQEQEYAIVINDQAHNRHLTFQIYCLNDDLYNRRPYRGDLHIHSYYSDGREAPNVVAANYRKNGYDFMALTDHFKLFPSQLLMDEYRDIPMNFKVFGGEEVHEPNCADLHIVSFGTTRSINEIYQNNIEQSDAEIDELKKSVPETYPDFFRLSVARRAWLVGKIRENGGMAILAHPHWVTGNAYNMRTDAIEYAFEHDLFDAYELIGGVTADYSNVQVALYCDLLLKGKQVPIVGSCDSHGTDPARFFGHASTIAFAPENTQDEIKNSIRQLYTVACEHYQGDICPRAYGPYRLVKYARFLLHNYFLYHDEFCFEEGRLMKDLASGDDSVRDLLKAHCTRLNEFDRNFYGR